jgi:hypothetical protein
MRKTIKIISDGTSQGTSVEVDDNILCNIKSIDIRMDSNITCNEVVITFFNVPIYISGDVEVDLQRVAMDD